MSTKITPTEFSISEFDTTATPEDENSVIDAIDEAIAQLLTHIDTGDLERILRSDKSTDRLKKEDTGRRKPEELTKTRVIEPLLEALGYTEYTTEVSGFSPNSKQEADYEFPIDHVEDVSSNRLLLEAEPINKPLNSKGHGINQVQSWLRLKDFEADYGIVTDGLKWMLIQRDPDSHAYNTLAEVNLQPVFIALFNNHITDNEPPEEVLDDVDLACVSDFITGFSRENFLAIASDAQRVIKQKQEEITDAFYDDYVQFVFGVTKDGDPADRSVFSLIGGGIRSPDKADGDDTRLFAVNLMNRFIFIKFLEDKQIVEEDTLSTLKETYKEGIYPDSFYKTFVEKLFFDVFNSKPPRDSGIQNIDLFNDIPYLNGGLFREELNEDKELTSREFDVNNEPLFQIIDFLETYSFSVGGGPTEMDPSVLGNVFEKTVTYLTTDAGDKNAELGAYYTPKEITRFSAEQTIYPALRDRFCEYMIDEWGWKENQAEQYETYRDVVDAVPADQNMVEGLLNEVDELSVLDPAAGSGHFLKAALEEIRSVREELRLKINDEEPAYKIMKRTVQNNIYGVEILGPALEIGKLRLWLNIVKELDGDEVDEFDAKELALPNVTFNLREGNSLIGLNEELEKGEDDQHKLEKWMPESVGDRYNDVIEHVELHEGSNDNPEKAEKHRREAEQLIEEYQTELDSKVYDEFKEFTDGITDDELQEFAPFHWILEFAKVYSEGGFDVIIGNPPWDRLTPNRDEYFTRHDETFSKLSFSKKDQRQEELLQQESVRKGWEDYQNEIKLVSEYFHQSETYNLQKPIVGGTTQATENDLSALFLERVYDLARDDAHVAQVLPGAIFNGASTKDLRMHLLDETRVDSLVTFENRGIFKEIDIRYKFGIAVFETGSTTDELNGLFHQTNVEVLNHLEKNALTIPREVLEHYSPEARIFPNIESEEELRVLYEILKHPSAGENVDDSWYASLYAELHRSGDSDRLVEDPKQGDYPVYQGKNIYQFSHSNKYVSGLAGISLWSVGEDVSEKKSGKTRVRGKNLRSRDEDISLKKAIYERFTEYPEYSHLSTQSQKGFVNDLLSKEYDRPGLSPEDVLLDSTEYRIALREVTNSTNERTVVASVLPKGALAVHTLHTVRPYKVNPEQENLGDYPMHSAYNRVFTDKELFVCVGLLNSIPFDYLMRTKVDTHVVKYKFEESQMPRLQEGNDWFHYISDRAARLNCYGEEFEEMRERLGGIKPTTGESERRELQAEIDAASSHAYGFDREEIKFILDDFHRVQNPRMMTEDYFELVLKKYDKLDDIGPLP